MVVILSDTMKAIQRHNSQTDSSWSDEHVFPEKPYPDVTFLYQRTNEVTLSKVAASKGESILDIGCGRASEMAALAQEGAQCFALDPSATMLKIARQDITEKDINTYLIQGTGEQLPFQDGSFNKVICKGAIDHFQHPDIAIEEMARILKPPGRAIIAVTSFESLGFKLGRFLFIIVRLINKEKAKYQNVLMIPADHTIKLDYKGLERMVNRCFDIEQSKGVSLLFGVPFWGSLLDKLPGKISWVILGILDILASRLPSLSNVIVMRCIPRPGI